MNNYNPIEEIAKILVKAEETSREQITGIIIHPLTYWEYCHNRYVTGIVNTGRFVSAFPGLIAYVSSNVPEGKIILVYGKELDFMEKVK